MLRRAEQKRRTKNRTIINDNRTDVRLQEPIGTQVNNDEEDKRLTEIVIGRIEVDLKSDDSNCRKRKAKNDERELQPLWEDEDDLKQTKTLSVLRYEKKSKVPKWIKRKEESSDSEEDDPEASELLRKTGNYLASSKSLPAAVIQMKQCMDANKEIPSQGKLKSVEFHRHSQIILTAGMDQTLSLFQVDGKKNNKIQSWFLDNFPIFAAHFNVAGEEIVLGSKHKSFKYLDLGSAKIVNVPNIKGIEEKSMERFVVSPNGKLLVFLGSFGSLHLISAKSKEWIQTLKTSDTVEAVTFNSDGSVMLSHGSDGIVNVWDMTSRDCLHRFIDDGCIKGTSIAMSPNNRYIATGCYSGMVNIYDSADCVTSPKRTPTPLSVIKNLTTPCTDLLFNPTNEILAMASNYKEKGIKLVHVPSRTVFKNFPDFSDNMRIPYCMHFSPNSGYFCVGNHSGRALLYRAKHYGNY